MNPYIPADAPPDYFPPTQYADEEGLLAVGGDLSPQRLYQAYARGIFPWFSDGEPILWWTPDPRMVLLPKQLKVSRSLAKNCRNGGYEITINQAFPQVIKKCAKTLRRDEAGTWITDDMQAAYINMHQLGHAHSVEAWHDGELVGGLYGIAIGKVFFGESMFATRSNASKVAFVHWVHELEQRGFQLIDCQVYSSHLASLGAACIPRYEFEHYLRQYCGLKPQ